MKIEKTVTVDVCDVCQKEEVYRDDHCFGCGKAICWTCQDKAGVKYPHSINCRGSGDGLYCLECNVTMAGTPLHQAYVAIRSLTHESEGFYASWKKRVDAAEKEAARLYDEQSASQKQG